MRRVAHWRVPLVLAAASGIAQAGGDAARLQLRFDRDAIGSGELWRLVTGHIVHLGMAHTVLNVVALLLVWLLIGSSLTTAAWLLVIACSLAGIDLGLWTLDPELAWYVGLSGLLHGMFAAGLVAQVRESPTETVAMGVLMIGKIIYEQSVGPLPGSEATSGGAVVVDAHLYGALAGALAALALTIGTRRNAPI